MSVMVIVKFPGAHVDNFKAVFDRHTELMSAISADGRSKGAIHHQFVEDENGDAMVVDEWGASRSSTRSSAPRRTSRRSSRSSA